MSRPAAAAAGEGDIRPVLPRWVRLVLSTALALLIASALVVVVCWPRIRVALIAWDFRTAGGWSWDGRLYDLIRGDTVFGHLGVLHGEIGPRIAAGDCTRAEIEALLGRPRVSEGAPDVSGMGCCREDIVAQPGDLALYYNSASWPTHDERDSASLTVLVRDGRVLCVRYQAP